MIQHESHPALDPSTKNVTPRVRAVVVKDLALESHPHTLSIPKRGDPARQTPPLRPTELGAGTGAGEGVNHRVPDTYSFQTGYEDGFRAGQEAGWNQGQRDAEEKSRIQTDALRTQAQADAQRTALIQDQLDQLIKSLREQQQVLHSQHIDEVIVLCFEAVSKIVGHLLLEPKQLIEMIRSILLNAKSHSNLTIHLNPKDYSAIQTFMATDAYLSDLEKLGIQIKPDSKILLGGALLASSYETVDARLETMMARFAQQLMQHRST